MKKVFFSLAMLALLMSGCYKDDINDLKDKYNSLQTVVNALQNQLSVSRVEDISGGYRIVFSDNSSIEVITPVFTVGDNGNWWIDGVDSGKKAEGSTPEIVDGYWWINGENTDVKAEGQEIIGITIQDGNMTFTFSNDETITVPMSQTPVVFTVACSGLQVFESGETQQFTVTQSGVQNHSIAKPDGWRVSLIGDKLIVTAPDVANPYAENAGTVSVVAVGDGATAIANIRVMVTDGGLYVIDFEDPRMVAFLAGPTSAGENLYSDFGAGQYIGYEDPSGLKMMIIEDDPYGMGVSREFWNGGIAISQWNDIATEGYFNQCSVFYEDGVTGFGGYDGSKTFAMNNNSGEISFEDNATECTFDHFWVTNSTYAALSMMNGDDFTKIFSYDEEDWFKLTITAYDKTGKTTGTPVEFYLADFRTATSSGIVTEWTKVDLTPLGDKVNTIKFDLESSDISWGYMNTPAYFCFDNLAIKF